MRNLLRQLRTDPSCVWNTGSSPIATVKNHFRARPFRWHFFSWMLIGLAFGVLLAPNSHTTTLLAFCISGCLTCGILSILTYPLSEHYRLTLAGALIGGLSAPFSAWMDGGGVAAGFSIQLCLIVGALIGGTSLVWLTPLRVTGMLTTART